MPSEIRLDTEEMARCAEQTASRILRPLELHQKAIADARYLLRDYPFCDSILARVNPWFDEASGHFQRLLFRLAESTEKLSTIIRLFEAIDDESAGNWAAIKAKFPLIAENPDLMLLLVLQMSIEQTQAFLRYGSLMQQHGNRGLEYLFVLLQIQYSAIQERSKNGSAEAASIFFPEHVSDGLLDFVSQWEGFLAAPDDKLDGYCTVGFGHVIHFDLCDGRASEQPYRDGITRAEGLELLRKDIEVAENVVKQYVRVPLNQQQYDALVSAVYNLGNNWLRESDLLKKLNAGDYASVRPELEKAIHIEINDIPVELPGLVRRRKAEGDIWDNGDYTIG